MSRTRRLVLAALFSALTAAGGFLKIPTPLSAITLQTLFTLMAGILLGPAWGAASQAAYVALGLVGLPIFTSGGGLSYLLNPTCGFLFGMVGAAATAGAIARPRQDAPLTSRRALLAGLAGTWVVYLVGLPYMYGVVNLYLGREMSPWAVLWSGCLLFLPGDLLKLAAASVLCPSLHRALARS